MMKCLRQCCDTGICQNYNHIGTPTEKQKDCNADVTWSGSSWKTSSVYGHQYHVTLAKFFLVVLKNYTCTSFFLIQYGSLPNKNIQSLHKRKA